MAAVGKCSIGDTVFALGTNVLEKSEMLAHFPRAWASTQLRGTVRRKGSGRKWVVAWQLPTVTLLREHGSRSLTVSGQLQNGGLNPQNPGNLVASQLLGSPSDTDSDMSISDDDMDMPDQHDSDSESEDEAPGIPDAENPLKVNDLCWTAEPAGVTDCYRELNYNNEHSPRVMWPANMRIDPIMHRTLLDYFMVMFPDIVEDICTWTSRKLLGDALTPHEFIKFIGIMIAMTRAPQRERADYWSESTEGLFPPLAFGRRFGMGKHRFNAIMGALTLHPPEADPADKWREVRSFVNAINARRKETFNPGAVICVDESSSKWCGLGDWYGPGLPHITKCARKPWNLAMEFKDGCCAQSQVIISLEIVEGKDVRAQEFMDIGGMKKGTAMLMRLTKNWHNTGRKVVADSYFASVYSSIFLRKAGLFFTGLVKNSSTFYPKKYLQQVEMGARGDTKTYLAVKDGVQMIAHVWNDPGKVGKPRKSIVSTCGTTSAGAPALRQRKRQTEDGTWEDWMRSVPRSKLVEHYFTWAGAIDRHNRQRMDGLRIEHTLEFRRWWLRCNTSFIGVIVVDAVNAYNFEHEAMVDGDAYVQLAQEMIFNTFRGAPDTNTPVKTATGVSRQFWMAGTPTTVKRRRGQDDDSTFVEDPAMTLKHVVRPLRTLEAYKNVKNAVLNCRVCGKQAATVYCVTCGINCHHKLLALCLPGTGRDCMSLHCAT